LARRFIWGVELKFAFSGPLNGGSAGFSGYFEGYVIETTFWNLAVSRLQVNDHYFNDIFIGVTSDISHSCTSQI
jgi:hypothetical protein